LWATVLALTVLAGAVSVYLTYAYYKVREGSGWQSFCEVSSRLSCDAVTASEFSAAAGIPIAWCASVFYAAVAWVAWRARRGRRTAIPRSPAIALLAAGAVASAFSVILATVSARLIGAFCPLCLALYVCNAALLVLGVVAARRGGERLGQAVAAECANLSRNVCRTIASVMVGAVLLGALPFACSLRPEMNRAQGTDLCAYVEAKRAIGDRSDTRLVVYTDYQCPFCRKADAALAGLRKADGLIVEIRHYPLDKTCNQKLQRTIHEGACRQAAAVICAEGLGAELGRLIFESGAKDSASLVRLAVGLGMEPAGFETCLESPETARRLAADIEVARGDDVRGTPTIFVDGRRYQGPLDAAAFDCLVRPSSSERSQADTRTPISTPFDGPGPRSYWQASTMVQKRSACPALPQGLRTSARPCRAPTGIGLLTEMYLL
jgi:serine/threonine-protein kinase